MSLRATVEEIVLHRDARGVVIEPVTLDQLSAQRNSHLVITQPGGVRGNHYHQRGAEITVLLGPALVRVREDQTVRDIEVPAGKAWRFFFPPGVAHAFRNSGAQPLVAIAFNTQVFDPAHSDTIREVLIAAP